MSPEILIQVHPGSRPVRDPEYHPESWLDALERGSLLHVVYERAVSEWEDGTSFADEGFEPHALGILEEDARRVLQRLPVPNRAVFHAELADLEVDLASFAAMLGRSEPRVDRTELASISCAEARARGR